MINKPNTKLFFLEPSYRCNLNCETGELIIISDSHVKKGSEVKRQINKDGYYKYKLNGKNVFAHRLVAEKILGKIPEGLVVNHKDGVKINNKPDNLEYVTIAENVKHAVRMGNHPSSCPERSGRYKDGRTKDITKYKREWIRKKNNVKEENYRV